MFPLPLRLRLRTFFFLTWLGGVLCPFLLGLTWLFANIAPTDPRKQFYFLAYGFAYTFWSLFLMMLLYRGPIAEIRRLAREAEILVLEHARDLLLPEEKGPVSSLEALADHLEKLGAAFRKRSLELERLIEEATRRLQLEKEVLALVLQNIAEAVLVVSKDFRIVLVNPAARRLFGAERAFLGGSALSIFDREMLTELFERLRNHPSGGCLPINWKGYSGSACLLREESGRILGLVLSFQAPYETHGLEPARTAEDLSSLTITETPRTWRPVAYDFDLFEGAHPRLDLLKSPLEELTYTAFDTETTGLEPSRGDRIVAIGAVRIERGRILREAFFHTLVNPERPIPPQATKIHGITEEMVKDKPPLREVLPKFLTFCRDTVLVAHNAAFDLKFLEIEAQKLGLKIDFPVVDTLFISYGLFEEFEDHNLDTIAKRLGIPVAGLHSALGDALLTAEIFLKLLPHLKRKGIRTLEDLFDFCQKMYSLRKLQKNF